MEETSSLAFKHEEEEDEEGRQNSHKQIDLRGLLVELGKRDILQAKKHPFHLKNWLHFFPPITGFG
jgi:hypothetical protein